MGNKSYELTNHMGNVTTVISDRKIMVDKHTYDPQGLLLIKDVPDLIADFYEAHVVSYSDYYPFGMVMPGRNATSASGYRYGFNGMEKDDEVKGSNNSLDFGARIYDPRVGRWLSVDPLQQKYPSLSPYNFVANSPLQYIDPDGRAIKPVNADGKKLLEAAISKYGGEDFIAAIRLTTSKGVYSAPKMGFDPNIEGPIALSPSDFKSALEDNGVDGLNKKEMKGAYNLYLKLQESGTTELGVFIKESPGMTTKPGESGTRMAKGESGSTNDKYRKFSNAFEKDNRALDEVTGDDGYGTLGFETMERDGSSDPSQKGTLIIDATNKSMNESVETLDRAIR